jgi:glycosyltransferase involved in cell wall biosynthesis
MFMSRVLRHGADAVIVHSEDSRRRITGLGLPPERVHVIVHGAFDYLTRLAEVRPLDPAVGDLEGRKLVLSFGLMRPHKGIDLLIEAFPSAPDDAVLVIAGRPLMPVDPLRARARELGILDRVRFVPRFVSEAEIPAYFRRADLVVLPYREVEQSGVVFTAMAFGSPLLLSAVGSFREIAESGAAHLFAPGDVPALSAALVELLSDDAARSALSEAARRAASGPYSWSAVAAKTAELYRSLLEQ